MEDIDSSLPSPTCAKRSAPDETSPYKKPLNLKGTQFTIPTPPDTEGSSNVSPSKDKMDSLRAGSPAPSVSTLSSLDVSVVDKDHDATATTNGSGEPPAKKRKLTPLEKQEKTREKEAKAKEKAELKARREEEKRLKEEEKRQKAEEKEEEKRLKDEEKRQKAEEKEAKKRERDLQEEKRKQEKLKKDRSQMRLGAFFQAKPTTPAKYNDDDGSKGVGSARRKSTSLEPFSRGKDQIPNTTPNRKSKTPKMDEPLTREATPTFAKEEISDYRKFFLPFALPSHSRLYEGYTIKNPLDLAYFQGVFDSNIKDPSFSDKIDLGIIPSDATIDRHFSAERDIPRGISIPNLRQLLDQIQGTSAAPIDLTQDQARQNPMSVLQAVPRRHIEFSEDIRPPYSGTFTRVTSPQTMRKASRNPFAQVRTDTDYDYDSELEWEDNDDGDAESLRGDEDDEAESQGDAEEMEGFLDDENDGVGTKRKIMSADLKPASTGLCWANESNKSELGMVDMQGMRIGFLLPGLRAQSIDPFSTSYWQHEMAPPPAPILDCFGLKSGRPPLKERSSNTSPLTSVISSGGGEKGPITVVPTKAKKEKEKTAPKVISSEHLERFREAVVGSPLTKVELQLGLKDRFKTVTHEVIRDTLGTLFARRGSGRDKVWVFTGGMSSTPAPDASNSSDLPSAS